MLRNLILTCLVLILAVPRLAGAAEDAADPQKKDGFQPITTHIEADPWRLLKIERPEPDGPLNKDLATSDTHVYYEHVGFNVIGQLDMARNRRDEVCFTHVYFFELPFFSAWHTGKDGRLIWSEAHSENCYLFALFDGIVEKQIENPSSPPAKFKRLAFLDSCVFTGYKMIFNAPQRMYWEALDLPLSTTISH